MESLQNLSGDLLIEILCKLDCTTSLNLPLVCKKLFEVYTTNENHINRKIVNSYQLLFTGQTNIKFLLENNIYHLWSLITSNVVFTTSNESNVNSGTILNEPSGLRFWFNRNANDNSITPYNPRLSHELQNLFTTMIKNNRLNDLKFFMKNYIDDIPVEWNALQWASHYGYIDIVKLFLDYGFDIHQHNDTALCWAVDAGHLEVTRVLLEKGAIINTANNYPLRSASKNGYTKIVDLLISYGA